MGIEVFRSCEAPLETISAGVIVVIYFEFKKGEKHEKKRKNTKKHPFLFSVGNHTSHSQNCSFKGSFERSRLTIGWDSQPANSKNFKK